MLSLDVPHGAKHLARRSLSRPATWVTGWLGLASLGVANGALREVTYQPWVGERTGHQISTVTLLAMVGGYAWWLQRRWPLLSDEDAVAVGAAWAALTVAFEFSMGRLVADRSFAELWADYDLTSGNLWALVPLGIALAPLAARRAQRRSDDRSRG